MAKTIIALTLAAGLLAASVPVAAQDGKVEVLYGQQPAKPVSVTLDEGGTGVTVLRGTSNFVPAKPAAVEPVTFIDGEKIRINSLEPADNWFLDRSGGRLTVINCYTQQSVYVGGARRILCSARQL